MQTGLTKLLREVRNRKQEQANHLLMGNAKDYADYRYLVGVVDTLGAVEAAILSIDEGMEHEDD